MHLYGNLQESNFRLPESHVPASAARNCVSSRPWKRRERVSAQMIDELGLGSRV